MTYTEQVPWAGLWTRIGACIVDGLIIGVVGFLVGAIAFETLASIGDAARLIGLGISVLYFGLMGSRLGGGQTIGMRLFRLQIVDLAGRSLSLGPACLRAFVLVLPFVLNGMMLSGSSSVTQIFGLVAAVAIFGVVLAQVCLLFFNRPSRRLLHDLIAKSVVVRAGCAPLAAPSTRAIQIAVVVCLLIPLVPVLLLPSLSRSLEARLQPSLAAVQGLPGVMSASVIENETVSKAAGAPAVKSRALVVTARLQQWPADEQTEAARIAVAARSAYNLQAGQTLTIILRRGYDIGIASSWRSYVANFPGLPGQIVINPHWHTKPRAEDIESAYPPGAAKLRVAGEAAIACRVRTTGKLMACQVVYEKPLGYGFGKAALQMTNQFKFTPMSVDGVPSDDGHVRIPITFKPPK
jgi:TonB family protein